MAVFSKKCMQSMFGGGIGIDRAAVGQQNDLCKITKLRVCTGPPVWILLAAAAAVIARAFDTADLLIIDPDTDIGRPEFIITVSL